MSKKKRNTSKEIADEFFERLRAIVGSSAFVQIRKTFVERPTTFRMNRLKHANIEAMKRALFEQGFKLKQVPWYADAFILLNKSKRELMETDVYREGKIYIQSLASMVPPLVLDPQPGEKILDLTAAPGSKTSQIAALMEKQGELVGNDNNKPRFFKLKHNMEMLGVSDGDESNGWKFFLRLEDGWKLCAEYLEYFDKILLDAPCGAEARFVEGKPRTFAFWSERKIKEMAYKQQKLLLSAWQALRPGGILVYSTCTWAPEENESRVSKLLERYPDTEVAPIDIPGLQRLPVVKEWRGRVFDAKVKNTLRIKPTAEIEGFFVAKLRK